jgi:TolB-like protein/DNA-binding winged helix-turn-helix (wHTH) protein/Flp pilus assembly protein TadD
VGPQDGSQTIRFGDGLELDPLAWELRRDGQPQKLERMPMQILMFLAQQRGQLVSREQIVEKIWGKDVYLDTDNSINGAMRKIRQVLGDDPGEPRYIQTVTGRGYRFVAPLASEPPAPATAAASDPVPGAAVSTVATGGDGAAAVIDLGIEPQVPRWLWWLAAALLLFIILATAWLVRARFAARPALAPTSTMLAVLPLTNLTGDAAQDYFSDGLTEELIAQLGNVDPAHLSVIARTSVMGYKNTRAPINEIARTLGAQYVLEGSVRRDSQNVRVTAQLVRASDQAHVWARQYDRELSSVLALQGEIAAEIADGIRTALGERPVAVNAAAQPARSPEEYAAYDLYLRGLYFWNQRNVAGFRQALDYFQQAAARDPRYAPARAGLAYTYSMMSNWGLLPAREAMPLARSAAQRAVELDPNLAEGHAALAVIAEDYDYDWRTAEREFRRAIQLNPNYATAHQWYAVCLADQRRYGDALTESDRARALDPLSPIVGADRAAIYYFARQYPRAIEAFRAVLAMDPRLGRAHMIVQAYVEEGRTQEALEHIDTWNQLDPGPWIHATRAYVYGRAGDTDGALASIAQLEQVIHAGKPWRVDPAALRAFAWAGLKDKPHTLQSLEAGYANRQNFITEIKAAPTYDFLHGDPRYEDLLHRIGLK